MMWLGRTEIYLIAPNVSSSEYCSAQTFDDVKRQIIGSYLIKELIDVSNVYDHYLEIENTIKIFAGEQDNVTLDNLIFMKNAVGFNDTDELIG